MVDLSHGCHQRPWRSQLAGAARHDGRRPAAGGPGAGFLVCGYDSVGVGEAFEVTVPDGAVEQIATTQNGGGAAWRARPTW